MAAFCVAFSAQGFEVLAQEKSKGRAPAPVEVSTVTEEEVSARITLVGSAEAWLETIVAAEEPGLVLKMLVDEGQSVRKGQVLCETDQSRLKLKIEVAKAALAEAKVLLAQSEREWERQKRLFSINSVSEKAYENAQFENEAALRKVERLGAEINVLEDQLKKKRIKAPVSGSVTKRHALVGQWLKTGDPVVNLAVLNPIRVMVPVPGRYVTGIKVGEKARVTFDALPAREFEGRIAAVIPSANNATRTFPVRVEVPNVEGDVKAGMLGRITLPVGKPYKALLVPKDAMVLRENGTAVYIVKGDTAHLVQVETGPARGRFIEVTGDLVAGSSVVIRGNERLMSGQSVMIIRPSKKTGEKAGEKAGKGVRDPGGPHSRSKAAHETG